MAQNAYLEQVGVGGWGFGVWGVCVVHYGLIMKCIMLISPSYPVARTCAAAPGPTPPASAASRGTPTCTPHQHTSHTTPTRIDTHNYTNIICTTTTNPRHSHAQSPHHHPHPPAAALPASSSSKHQAAASRKDCGMSCHTHDAATRVQQQALRVCTLQRNAWG